LDLPTYTNIWRIEKRLYKLYDFRLPMPLPVGQIAVFAAIAVPYVVILKVAGLPFSHTLLWLYILPPGALAWLVTRPVLEGKRLPELVVSQVRYLTEPRTWCRMAPLAEKDEVLIVARVWRRLPGRPAEEEMAVRGAAFAEAAFAVVAAGLPADGEAGVVEAPGDEEEPAAAAEPALAASQEIREAPLPDRRGWPYRAATIRAPAPPPVAREATAQGAPGPASAGAARPVATPAPAAQAPAAAPPVPVPAAPAASAPAPASDQAQAPPPAPAAAPAAPPAPPKPSRPVVTVTGDDAGERPMRLVERALGNPAGRRAIAWREQVVVVPGGHRPGRPDQMQRDRARARLPVPGGCRVVVLGCTAGAGQTVTALMTGEVLASLREDQVAVLDLNPGPGSLAERARAVPPLTGPGPHRPSRLEVVTREEAAGSRAGEEEQDVTTVFELLSARYPLTLADPAAAVVPRVLAAAGQLVLVAPASQDAASALAATREWLEANGHGDLAEAAIVVLNGYSRHTMPHVEQAEALARGRCRAIVRVPWDDRLKGQDPERTASSSPGPRQESPAGPLSPAALHAYTALAGVLVAAVASVPEHLRVRS
jgi:MinD-like ATPase involved in chromosome partitioning or flagellar assembly